MTIHSFEHWPRSATAVPSRDVNEREKGAFLKGNGWIWTEIPRILKTSARFTASTQPFTAATQDGEPLVLVEPLTMSHSHLPCNEIY
eukprot:s640_g13.t1